MRKILIAIDNNFIRESYVDLFKREKFEVLETRDSKEVLALVRKEKPDIILLDIFLLEIGKFDLLEKLKKSDLTARVPVIIFAQQPRKEDRIKAIELEAKDFIAAGEVSPFEVVRRVKIALGEQKSYRIKISPDTNVKNLIKDLTGSSKLKCPQCGSYYELYLIRDLLAGENHFIVSFVCPQCD